MEVEQRNAGKLIRLEEFYKGRNVFLTGATGFLGRMTLEKLLRSCGGVQKIYVLLRAKKGKDPEQRLDDLFDCAVFDKLRADAPEFRKKVIMIEGDCQQPELGMKPEARETIIREVDIIIHWAATVKFDEPLKQATNINVRVVRDLIVMCKEMPQLKTFLHVSTAFSNCVYSEIDEKFYPVPIGGEALINMMDALSTTQVEKMTPILLEKWPNTYVFTKAVAENLIREEAKNLPIGILRPSMVLASYKEPVPGWIDNVYGPTGTMIGMAIGLIRVMRMDLNCTAEVVPSDYVVNTAMAAIVDIHDKRQNDQEDEEIPIYNCVSSVQNYMTWRTYADLSRKHCLQIPSPKIIWHSIQVFATSTIFYNLAIFFLHLLPAYVIDIVAKCLGRQPMMVKAYQKIHQLISTLSYFSTRSWKYQNKNVQQLWHRLSHEDQENFEFDMSSLDWDTYFAAYTRGGRRFILHDTLDTIPEGQKKLQLLKCAHYALCMSLLFIFYKLVSWMLHYIY